MKATRGKKAHGQWNTKSLKCEAAESIHTSSHDKKQNTDDNTPYRLLFYVSYFYSFY